MCGFYLVWVCVCVHPQVCVHGKCQILQKLWQIFHLTKNSGKPKNLFQMEICFKQHCFHAQEMNEDPSGGETCRTRDIHKSGDYWRRNKQHPVCISVLCFHMWTCWVKENQTLFMLFNPLLRHYQPLGEGGYGLASCNEGQDIFWDCFRIHNSSCVAE